MRTHRPLPPSVPGSFRVADALAAGLTPKRLRQRDLGRPFHGARSTLPEPVAAEEQTALDHALARVRHRIAQYLPVMPVHAFFAGATAAAVLGIPVPLSALVDRDGALRPLVVGVHAPRTPPRRPGVTGIRMAAEHAPVTVVEGVPVLGVEATWVMLGAVLGERDLVAAADHVIRIPRMPGGFGPPEREPFGSRETLEAALRGRRGAARLRAALDRARTGASSPRETRVRLILVDGGLPEPVLDHDVHDRLGVFIRALDLCYPELRVGIEYDGSGHRDQRQFEKDVERLERLAEEGWIIVRLTAADLRRGDAHVVRRVRAALARAAGRDAVRDRPSGTA